MTWGTFSRCPRCQSQGLKPLLHYVSVGLWDSVSQRLLCWICYISCHIHRPFTLRSVPLAHEETSYDALVPLSFHANYSLPASPLGFILLSWTKQDIRDLGAERGNIPRTLGKQESSSSYSLSIDETFFNQTYRYLMSSVQYPSNSSERFYSTNTRQ